MHRADLSVSVSQRKLACVLDPALVLGHAFGPTLALRLTQVMEPWLTRSFWQTLDASELLLRQSERADSHAADSALSASALAEWIALREGTDAGSWVFRWIGDRLAESQVQDAADIGVVDRFERLAEALAQRWERSAPARASWGFDALAGALDALALSATLDGALVLGSAGAAALPWPVQAARRIELAESRLEPERESLFAAERSVVREALARAGLAPLLANAPPLAALHLVFDDTLAPESDTPDPCGAAHLWWYLV